MTGVNAFDPDDDGTDDLQVQYEVWNDDNPQLWPGAHGWFGHNTVDWRSLPRNGEPMPDIINDSFIVGRDIEHCTFCDGFDWFHQAGHGSLWRSSNVQAP